MDIWPVDEDWREIRGARVSSLAHVLPWANLSPGVVVHPFALVGHLASQSRALAHKGTPYRFLRVGERTEIGPHSTIYGGAIIGEDTLVGDGASIREDVRIGDRCIIGRHVTIGFGATIGNDVRIMDGSFVAEGAVIGDRTLLGAGVVMSGHRQPDLNDYKYTENRAPIIDEGCLIGSGANLLPGVRIGAGAVIAAGAVVAESVPPNWKAVGPKAAVSYVTRPPTVLPLDHHRV